MTASSDARPLAQRVFYVTEALACQTGVDPKLIVKDSPLLEYPLFWVQIANASAAVWITIGASILALVAWSLL